jgi:hypothetical protein
MPRTKKKKGNQAKKGGGQKEEGPEDAIINSVCQNDNGE